MKVNAIRNWRARAWAMTLAAVIAVTGAACGGKKIVQQPTGRLQVQDSGFNQFSPEQEVELGRQAAAEVERQLPVLEDSHAVSKYVAQLGQNLAAKAPGNKYPYRFRVVNQKEINAFALPGGPIYINVGTIQAADDEGQLAGVVAHEISHVALRHSTEQASKATLAQLPVAILGSVMGQGVTGQLAQLGISFAAGTVMLKYSRDAEREADLVGAQIMYDAGLNPSSMVEFFSELEKEGGGRGPEFLASHPNPGNRAALVQQVVAKFPKKDYPRQDSADFRRIKGVMQGMKPMTAKEIAQRQQQQGAAERITRVSREEVMPSREFRTMDHSAFRVAHPANWQVLGQQNSAVVIAPRSAVSQNAIAYGVMIGGMRSDRGTPLEQATSELVQAMLQSNPEMQASGQAKRTTVNGVPALAVEMRGPSPLGDQAGAERERDLLVSLQRPDGNILYLVFIAPERDFAALEPAFQQMLNSLEMK